MKAKFKKQMMSLLLAVLKKSISNQINKINKIKSRVKRRFNRRKHSSKREIESIENDVNVNASKK